MQVHSPPAEFHKRLRMFLKYSWIAVGLAALLSAWTFISRWESARKLEREAAEQRRIREQEQARRAFENLGGTRFEILHFYAQPAVIRRGESTTLCYGASNAKAVKLEPEAARVWPSANRCFDISPRQSTTYRLTIEGADGQKKSASIELQVR